MPPLAELQRRLGRALLEGPLEDAAPHVAAPGLAGDDTLSAVERLRIHGNNVLITLAEALAANFPVTASLTGEGFFTAAAIAYIRAKPPHARSLIGYGAGFPDFIARFKGGADLPYLADVARLDRACQTAYHGPEAVPINPATLASIPETAWPTARVRLHPTLTLLRSAFPIDAIWRAHQPGAPPDWTIDLGDGPTLAPTHVIVARPHATVQVLGVPAGLFALVQALAADRTLARACERAATAEPAFDPAAALAAIISNEIIVAIRAAEMKKT